MSSSSELGDGNQSALCQDFRLMQQAAFAPIEAWSNIQHPNIVTIREAFTTKSFDDNCKLPFSLSSISHFSSSTKSPGYGLQLLSECQNTLRYSHKTNFATTSTALSKLLILSPSTHGEASRSAAAAATNTTATTTTYS